MIGEVEMWRYERRWEGREPIVCKFNDPTNEDFSLKYLYHEQKCDDEVC